MAPGLPPSLDELSEAHRHEQKRAQANLNEALAAVGEEQAGTRGAGSALGTPKQSHEQKLEIRTDAVEQSLSPDANTKSIGDASSSMESDIRFDSGDLGSPVKSLPTLPGLSLNFGAAGAAGAAGSGAGASPQQQKQQQQQLTASPGAVPGAVAHSTQAQAPTALPSIELASLKQTPASPPLGLHHSVERCA